MLLGLPCRTDQYLMAKSVNDHVEWLEAAAKQAGVVDYSKTMGISPDLPPGTTTADVERQRLPVNDYLGIPRKAIYAQLGGACPFEIIIGDHVDSGGMADVDAAIQISLSREVVIKRVKRGLDSQANCDALRREAMIMGKLEHPNIPPVHELAYADGVPLVLMKRIHGTGWDGTIGVQSREGLLADLQILIQVCHAVEYAQSKGIVHLDIKPANVMIGDFGEVCLLDWGCAVELDVNGQYQLNGFQGTPSYAAPEMVEGSQPLTHQTDIYQLGATVHHILTGQGLHKGRTFLDVVLSALNSPDYDYAEDVDVVLSAIANKATSREPADRYRDVASFRDAIEEHVRYFHIYELIHSAEQNCQSLRDAIESAERNVFSFYQRAFEGRFACQQVLKMRPENEEAHRVNTEILLLLATHEIKLIHMVTARELIKEIRNLPHDAAALREVEHRYHETEIEQQRADELSTQIQYKLLEKLQSPDARD